MAATVGLLDVVTDKSHQFAKEEQIREADVLRKAIQQLVKIDPHVIGILSSGYCNDPLIAEYERYGFMGVVTKPYTISELGEKLNQVLINRQN